MINLCKDGAKGNQINYMVIPFAYEYANEAKTFEQFIQKLCNPERNRWTPVSLKENNNELYEHILSLTADDLTNNSGSCGERLKSNYIAQALRMNKEASSFPRTKLSCKGLQPKVTFTFDEIDLHLFNTGIGFLIIKMNYSELMELEQVITVNNQMKAIKHSEIYLIETKTEFLDLSLFQFLPEGDNSYHELIDDTDNKSKKYIQKDQLSFREEHLRELKIINYQKSSVLKVIHNVIQGEFEYKTFVNDLLSDFHIVTYFNQSFSETLQKQMSNKANVFSASNIKYENQEEKVINEAFFRLRKGYSKSYIPDEREYAEDNQEVYRPFHDSIWGVSREGCANLTYDSNEFMKFGYFSRTTNYFYLYIIALHQYYGLLNLAREISYLPATINECVDDAVYDRLIEIRNKCNFFYMKSVFEEVSHITHQSVFYNRLVQVLGIKNMQQELNYEIDRISAIVEQIKDKKQIKQKEAEEKKKEVQTFWLTAVGVVFSLFTVISVMNDTLSFWAGMANLEPAYQGYEVQNGFITVGLLFSVCILIILCIYLYHRSKRKESGKMPTI